MSEPTPETDPLYGVDKGRRAFLVKALAGTAVAAPVILSVALSGPAAFAATPNVSGATTTAAPTTTAGPTTTTTTTTSTTTTTTTTPHIVP